MTKGPDLLTEIRALSALGNRSPADARGLTLKFSPLHPFSDPERHPTNTIAPRTALFASFFLFACSGASSGAIATVGGAHGDAGTLTGDDAGDVAAPAEAGSVAPDAGAAPADAGSVAPDAGGATEAGNVAPDAGGAEDAGSVAPDDAGIDAASDDAGDDAAPFDAASLCSAANAPPAGWLPSLSSVLFAGNGSYVGAGSCPACAPVGWQAWTATTIAVLPAIPDFIGDAGALVATTTLPAGLGTFLVCTASRTCAWSNALGVSTSPATAGGVVCPPLGTDVDPADYPLPAGYTCVDYSMAVPSVGVGGFWCYLP